ncbi:MAG TPA: carboxypeptidase regulatory-like domain-containing protein, partial [Acidobacteriota bacterium]|nr:carboxypeptidase regulatory-like domain-containing protein [Acidobacteriota bacterium]
MGLESRSALWALGQRACRGFPPDLPPVTPPSATVSVTNQDVSGVVFTAKYDPCTISGTVTFQDGKTTHALRGVTVTATSGTEVRTAVTGEAGEYILGAFAKRNGTRATVVPSLTGYQFSPNSKSVQLNKTTQSGVDFTAKFPQNNVTYRIEGYVTMRDGTAIVDATVQLIKDGTLQATTTTADDGWYQFTGLASGDTFTVAPTYPCEYGFTPTQTEVTIAGADVMEVNFTARRLTYAIYGVVTAGGDVPISGVVVNLYDRIAGSGNLIASTTTDSSGRYQFAMLENGFYRVSTEENCFAETGLEMVVVFCENKEVNFECRIFSETERSEEKKSILRELNRLRGIDNKGRQADNGDMETAVDKDNPSALSLQPSARTEASVPTYLFYHWDHLGTVRLITSSTGTVVSRHDYEPFGVEIPPYPTGASDTAKNTHQYTGHERDKATGYDYMHVRYYGSNIGRFMKPDNVTGSPLNPQNWNLYSYVRGNPVGFNDPTGHWKEPWHETVALIAGLDTGMKLDDAAQLAAGAGQGDEGALSPTKAFLGDGGQDILSTQHAFQYSGEGLAGASDRVMKNSMFMMNLLGQGNYFAKGVLAIHPPQDLST